MKYTSKLFQRCTLNSTGGNRTLEQAGLTWYFGLISSKKYYLGLTINRSEHGLLQGVERFSQFQ
jgi:hypothetical protein